MRTIQILQFVCKGEPSKKNKYIYCLLSTLKKVNYVIPSAPFPHSVLPPLDSSRFFRFFCMITVICLWKHCTGSSIAVCTWPLYGHWAIIAGRSPPKAFEQIICTRVLVNYLEFMPPLFQMIVDHAKSAQRTGETKCSLTVYDPLP